MRGTIIAPIKWFQEHWVCSPSRASKLQSTGRFWKLPWFCSRRRIPATSLIRPCLCYFLLTSTEILCWCVQPAHTIQSPDLGSTWAAYSCIHHPNGWRPWWNLHAYPDLTFDLQRYVQHPIVFSTWLSIEDLKSSWSQCILACFLLKRAALRSTEQLVPFSSASQNLAHLPLCIPMPLSLISSLLHL